ncbi:hypothetical protein F4778DRAFT_512809 [Xylariomycetidae sp. FL2044]|nr:hypothetical protein F4778DRAFT_512809 [Xylariomycetidae sp. FL2044]
MPASTSPKSGLTTKQMWQACKDYFGDGFAPGSSPIRYNIHTCDMHLRSGSSSPTSNSGIRYGVEISEEAMPLYSIMGDTCAPFCTCLEMAEIVKHIDAFLETAPGILPGEGRITSDKPGDTNADLVSLYIMRDSLSWWVHWGGTLSPRDYWKQIYVGFAAIPDDIQISPQNFLDGTYRYLGHTWDDCREGLLGEGLTAEEVEFAEMCLWRQMLTQYFEKADPELLPLMKGKSSLMLQYRVLTANTLGCLALFMASAADEGDGPVRDAVSSLELEAASIAQCVTLDMAKEAMGILQGERTETVAGDRAQLKRELRWIYVRCMQFLETQPNAHILRRYASSGLHYVPMMDRYLERAAGQVRFPITDAMARILERFINRPGLEKGSEGLNANGKTLNLKAKVNGNGKLLLFLPYLEP